MNVRNECKAQIEIKYVDGCDSYLTMKVSCVISMRINTGYMCIRFNNGARDLC